MPPAVRIIGTLFFALAAGCAGVKEAPPPLVAQSGPLAVDPSPAGTGQDGAIAGEAEAAATAPPAPPSRSPSAAKSAPAPAKASPAPPAIGQPRKKEDPPAVTRNPEPPLDVAGLTTRLRDTDAIGVFTKLALKNQVDDLMKQFRTHHQSGQPSVASLRQPYDMLVIKVLSVVQDKDPSLARTISGSREAIWGILADPEKFNKVA